MKEYDYIDETDDIVEVECCAMCGVVLPQWYDDYLCEHCLQDEGLIDEDDE